LHEDRRERERILQNAERHFEESEGRTGPGQVKERRDGGDHFEFDLKNMRQGHRGSGGLNTQSTLIDLILSLDLKNIDFDESLIAN
jgi:hypothetical protein